MPTNSLTGSPTRWPPAASSVTPSTGAGRPAPCGPANGTRGLATWTAHRRRPTMVQTAVLGFPRIGPDRELKRALERRWSGGPAEDLEVVARTLRQGHRDMALTAGIDVIPCNDFSLYDHVLDTACMVGVIPERFAAAAGPGRETYFAMARGSAGIRPLEMTKWLDTNYHYLVPEIGADTAFRLDGAKPLAEFREALDRGTRTRPVLLGPLS